MAIRWLSMGNCMGSLLRCIELDTFGMIKTVNHDPLCRTNGWLSSLRAARSLQYSGGVALKSDRGGSKLIYRVFDKATS